VVITGASSEPDAVDGGWRSYWLSRPFGRRANQDLSTMIQGAVLIAQGPGRKRLPTGTYGILHALDFSDLRLRLFIAAVYGFGGAMEFGQTDVG
jgi:hypothetical protein